MMLSSIDLERAQPFDVARTLPRDEPDRHEDRPRRVSSAPKSGDHAKPKKKGPDEKVWNPRLVDGFAKSAAFIVRDKDKGSALFRRFDTSSMRNLLYLQARVASLTARQEAFDAEDFQAVNRGSDLKFRLEQLQNRLAGNNPRDFSEDSYGGRKITLQERIEDLALCFDFPLLPLKLPGDGEPPVGESGTVEYLSLLAEFRPLPLVGRSILDGDLNEQVDNIWLMIGYRNKNKRDFIDRFYNKHLSVEDRTTLLEDLLQDSLRASFERQIAPVKLLNFNMSWEDMELFQKDQTLYERRRDDWNRSRIAALNRGEYDEGSWPWDHISEHWKMKLQDRFKVALDLKHALREYHEALVAQRAVFQLPQPAERTKTTQADWFTGELGIGDMPQFIDGSADIFGADMVSLGTTGSEDYLSKKLPEWIPSIFVALKQSDNKVRYTSEKKVGRWVGAINGIAAIGFLVAAVWVLSVVSSYKTSKDVRATKIELGIMTGFILLFATWVGYLTTLSRKEVFGAVAAYAAVLVVFVGGSTG